MSVLFNIIFFTGIIGYGLLLGSIAAFVAMNAAIGKQPSITAVYWQRLFVNKISSACALPGIWLLAVSCFVAIFLQPPSVRTHLIITAVLNSLILINTLFFLSPLIKKVSSIAVEQMNTSTPIPAFASLKKTEDQFGAVNLILLLASLVTVCFMRF